MTQFVCDSGKSGRGAFDAFGAEIERAGSRGHSAHIFRRYQIAVPSALVLRLVGPQVATREARDQVASLPLRDDAWGDGRAAVVARLVLNRIATDPGVCDQFECALVSGEATPSVNAISERDDGFAPRDRRHFLGDRAMNRVVKAGQVAA